MRKPRQMMYASRKSIKWLGGAPVAAPHVDYWPVDAKTSVDTDELLHANTVLRGALQFAEEAQVQVAQASNLVLEHPWVEGIDALSTKLTLIRWTLETWIEDAVDLVAMRERAAQIYASAENSLTTYFEACGASTISGCPIQIPPLALYVTQVLPGGSGPVQSVGVLAALPQYVRVMLGHTPGSGSESLLAQMQMARAGNALNPMPGGGIAGIAGAAATLLRPASKERVLLGHRPNGSGPVNYALVGADGVHWSGWGAPQTRTVGDLTGVPGAPGRGANVSGGGFAPAGAVKVATPQTPGAVIGLMAPQRATGEIQVLRHQTDGANSWSVLIRGTKTFGIGGDNPHDFVTNLQELSGTESVQRAAVRQALEMAGAQPGDAVELAGHSQGGMVAVGVAQDPEMANKYRVVGVVTVGSPIGDLAPANVPLLAYENLRDIVPSLDGAANPSVDGHLTVYFSDRAGPGGPNLPHEVTTYRDAATTIEADDETVSQWSHDREEALNLRPSTVTTSYSFETRRVE